MRNKKIAITCGAAAVCAAITVTVFAGFAERPSEYAENTGAPNAFTSAAHGDWSAGTLGKMLKRPAPVYSRPAAESIPEAKPPVFDDPDSYLKYDPENDTYILPESEEELCDTALFVGDSICSGFSAWSAVNAKNVYATGNVAARNMLKYEMFYLNEPAKFVSVLNETKPERVFFSMGMNDVNITSANEFCANYKEIITTALLNSDAEIYVCAITPISNLKFTKLARIDEFNDAMKRFIAKSYYGRVHFVSFAEPLKDENGLLSERYNGGDGIHLGKQAYFVAIHELYQQVTKAER